MMQQHYHQLHAAGRMPSAAAAAAAAATCAAAGWSVPSEEDMRHNLAQVQMHLQAQQQAQMQAHVQMSQAQMRGQMQAQMQMQMQAQFQAQQLQQQAQLQRAPAFWSPITNLGQPPAGMPKASSGKAPAEPDPAPLPATLAEVDWSKPPDYALPPGATVQARGISTRAQSHSRSRARSDSTAGDSASSREASAEVSEEAGEAVSAQQVSAQQVSALLLVLMRQRTRTRQIAHAHAHAKGHPPIHPPTRRGALSSPKGKQHAQCAESGGDRMGAAGGAMVACTMVGCTDGAAEGAGGGGGDEAPGPMQAAMQAFGRATPVYYAEAMDGPMEEVSTVGVHRLTTLLLTPYYLTNLLPCYLAPLLPCYLATYYLTTLPYYATTLLPYCLTTLLPYYPTTLLPYYWLLATDNASHYLRRATGEHRGDGARAAAQGAPPRAAGRYAGSGAARAAEA